MNHQCYVKPEKIECPHAHPTFEITQHDRDEKGFTVIRFHLFCTDCRGDFAFRRPSAIVKTSENYMDMYVFGEFTNGAFLTPMFEPAEKKEYVPTLHDQAIALCAAIERLPASPEQTEVSIQASELVKRITDVKSSLNDWETYCQPEVDTLKKQVAILQKANEVAIGNERAARALSNVIRGERDALAVKMGEAERKLENMTNYCHGCEEQVKHVRSERDHALKLLKEANVHIVVDDGMKNEIDALKLHLSETHAQFEVASAQRDDARKQVHQLRLMSRGFQEQRIRDLEGHLTAVTQERDALKKEFRIINEMAERIL